MSPALTQEVSLETIGNGALPELFGHEWNKLLANAQDPNTDPEETREITIKVKVKPNKNRDEAQTRVSISSKLASFSPVQQRVFMGEKNGAPVAVTFDPKQGDMFRSDSGVTPIARKDAANQ